MKDTKTNNQQLSLDENILESSETIPNGSTQEIVEAVPTLTDNAEGNDIVQNLRRFNRLNSKEQFLEKIYKKFGNKFTFDLTNYSGITGNKIKVICPIHGEFEQTPRNLIQPLCKTGCKQCGLESKNKSKTKDLNNFLEKANKIHNNKYDYICDNYVNRKSKVIVICKEHGEFIKTAQKHLSGQGCFKCRMKELVEKNILVGGYSEDLFKRKPELKEKKAYLYYLSLNNGKMFKIGISTKLESRMRGIKCNAKGFIKKIDILWTIEDTLYNCFLKEQEILNNYKDKRVFMKFSTELFNENILPIKLNQLN
jgi:hypothetical protein